MVCCTTLVCQPTCRCMFPVAAPFRAVCSPRRPQEKRSRKMGVPQCGHWQVPSRRLARAAGRRTDPLPESFPGFPAPGAANDRGSDDFVGTRYSVVLPLPVLPVHIPSRERAIIYGSCRGEEGVFSCAKTINPPLTHHTSPPPCFSSSSVED